MNRSPARLSLVTAALAGSLLLLAGCSGTGDSGASGDSDAGGSSASRADDGGGTTLEKSLTDGTVADAPADSAAVAGPASGKNRPAAQVDDLQQALIKKGTVELTSTDVGRAGFEVQKIADRYSGQVTEEQTETSDDGDPSYSRMVLRVPVAHFDDAMDDISAAAELVGSNTKQEDVTSELIDTRTRIEVQKRSIARISVLFDRAQSIRDIMAIEAQLSRRQADLESLERRAAYLSHQSSYSTITVDIDRTPEKKAAVAKDDDSGFVAGLKAGWGGLSTFAVGLATVLGALLPWLVVVALVGPPAYLLVRWLRRRLSARSSGRTPSAA
ncbi:DUF4349 domain-containing protein [Nocardioides mangrovi]|uniref:DUF4349 domain-containing protein n=1 Tax=Nocardioides mangrovi TaxID=2874580 RepID=A0ABS7UAB2_9ACTN|nr:DUF4349 domain-containing protein [Nocardioides mangrovi]MBZ5737592.1 DUF4349 domain-containing protein [Nocardioides mangrovi]